jgi:hypothetical protein
MPIRLPIIPILLPIPTCPLIPFIPNTPSTIFEEKEAIMSQELPIPPHHNYTAGALRGPYYQPTLFDKEENHKWPLLPSCQEVWVIGETSARQPDSHICYYYRKVRH